MIRIEHLYKSFGEAHVLKDISIEYRQGLCNMIIGASGSGKTVLLKILIGLMQQDSISKVVFIPVMCQQIAAPLFG